jgi:hypothetical protein
MSKESSREIDSEKDCPVGMLGTESSFVRSTVKVEINKGVIRQKLKKQRHLVVERAIDPAHLDSIFPALLKLFRPQTVIYNGGIAKVPEWKISCYLEVMPGGIPTTNPNLDLLELFRPVLNACNDLFLHWYRQQHACNSTNQVLSARNDAASDIKGCHRLMTFITRYTPKPGEQALLKVRYHHASMHSTKFRLRMDRPLLPVEPLWPNLALLPLSLLPNRLPSHA